MAKNPQVLGFGFIPTESRHHFLVTIPAAKDAPVIISEHFDWREEEFQQEVSLGLGEMDNKVRVILSHRKWEAIAQEVKAEFNRRLKQNGRKTGQWKTGQVPLSRLFGKELVLLAWAIEDAELEFIPLAVKNWLGLAPEERWWLFTMTNAATGHAVTGRGRGWRKALYYALAENPVSVPYLAPPMDSSRLYVKEHDRPWATGAEERQKKLLE